MGNPAPERSPQRGDSKLRQEQLGHQRGVAGGKACASCFQVLRRGRATAEVHAERYGRTLSGRAWERRRRARIDTGWHNLGAWRVTRARARARELYGYAAIPYRARGIAMRSRTNWTCAPCQCPVSSRVAHSESIDLIALVHQYPRIADHQVARSMPDSARDLAHAAGRRSDFGGRPGGPLGDPTKNRKPPCATL